MIKKLIATAFLFLFLAPAVALAADIRETDYVGKGENPKNLYVAGQNPTIDADVKNDLTAAGGTVTVNGNVENSAFVAGGTLNIKGDVGNTLRVAGGTINIDGKISEDLLVAGGNVVLNSGSEVLGDVLMAGGTINLNGKVDGKVLGTGGMITLNGPVGGDVKIEEVGTLVLAENADIKGNLEYSSPTEAQKRSGAVVQGETKYQKVSARQFDKDKAFGFTFASALFGLVGGFVLIFALWLLFPKTTKNLVMAGIENPWVNIGIGFVVLVVAPAAVIFALVTIIGIPLALLAGMLYFASLFFASLLGTVTVGTVLKKWFTQAKEFEVNWVSIVIGILAMALLKVIPVLGWLVIFGLFLLGLGAITKVTFEWMKSQRA